MTAQTMAPINRLPFFLLSVCLAWCVSASASEDLIEINPQPTVTFREILQSPIYLEHQEEIREIAAQKIAALEDVPEAIKTTWLESLDDLPSERWLDIELVPTTGSVPDIVSFCLEGHPTRRIAIEGCATTFLMGSSILASVKYRWDLLYKRDSRGAGHELSFGPGVAIRSYQMGFGSQDWGIGADLLASLEYVLWLNRQFGVSGQLDIGLTVWKSLQGSYQDPFQGLPNPFYRLSFGVTF